MHIKRGKESDKEIIKENEEAKERKLLIMWLMVHGVKGSPESIIIQPDIQQLGARVSTKGSNAQSNVQPSREYWYEPSWHKGWLRIV